MILSSNWTAPGFLESVLSVNSGCQIIVSDGSIISFFCFCSASAGGIWPCLSSNRRLLYQSTHVSVVSSSYWHVHYPYRDNATVQYRAFPKRSPHHSNPTRHSIFDHEERQIISVNVSVVTNNNSVLYFFGLRPAHVAIRCHFPDSFLLYGVVWSSLYGC